MSRHQSSNSEDEGIPSLAFSSQPAPLFPSHYLFTSPMSSLLRDAAFGANLDDVKKIIEKTPSGYHRELFFTPRPDTPDWPPPRPPRPAKPKVHLDTAFKVALATGDEEMAEEIAKYLDPAEIELQFKDVFGPNYAAFLERQEKEAEALFVALKAACNNAKKTYFALPQKIAEFKTQLENYVNQPNQLHNDYILAKAYEIYDNNYRSFPPDLHKLFSIGIIGLIQKSTLKTSKRRSMDIAEGLDARASRIKEHRPSRRSFLARCPAGISSMANPGFHVADIRFMGNLGSHWCIDLGGELSDSQAGPVFIFLNPPRQFFGGRPIIHAGGPSIAEIMSSKNICFERFAQLSKSDQSRCCSVM